MIADNLCHATSGAFVLISPTHRLVLPKTTALLVERQAEFRAIGDVLGVDDRGRLAAHPRAAELVSMLRQRFTATVAPPPIRFPTPPGSQWDEISIRFITQEQVHIRVRQAAGAYEFSQVGMEDRRSHRPDAQWRLLQTFAEHGGEITWRDAVADRKNAKRRQLLARVLQHFFGIDDDPFLRVSDGKGWRCRFTLIPEA